MLEKELMKSTRDFFALASLYYYGLTISCIPIILVCQPTTNVWLHSVFFLNVIFSCMFITIFEFLISRGSLDSLASKIYLGVYTFVSIYDTCAGCLHVGERAPGKGYLPVWIIKSMDITWFTCLVLTADGQVFT